MLVLHDRRTILMVITKLVARGICCFAAAINISYASVLESLPDIIDKNDRFLFYSHGYIVEGSNPKPEHPRWGVYDYPAILAALTTLNMHIIAEHRAAKTDPFQHAEKLAKQVRQLIESGVPAKNITLVGFSRGGFITAIASDYLTNKALNFVILAACTSGLNTHEKITLHGHILSIYETSDTVGSCKKIVKRSADNVTSFKEFAITTGKEHGAFYKPVSKWLRPVQNWVKLKTGRYK